MEISRIVVVCRDSAMSVMCCSGVYVLVEVLSRIIYFMIRKKSCSIL